MARYIDAEKVMEKISHITVMVMGGRSYGKTIFGKALNSYREEVLKRIEDAPTADVVPKSEVEELSGKYEDLKLKYADLQKDKDELIAWGGHITSAEKAEVAREIFEEIEELLKRTCEKGYCGSISDLFAELKKKYIEN